MNKLYDVTVEYFGERLQDTFASSTICLGKEGRFLVMDSKGEAVRFDAYDCRVDEIAANVIILRGYTQEPMHIVVYCVYAGDSAEGRE